MNIKKLLIMLMLLSLNKTFAAPLEYDDYLEELFDHDSQCIYDDFFKKDGPNYIREINKKFDEQLDEIFKDNISHPTHSVKMIVQDLRTYNTRFSSLCKKIEENCSSGTRKNIVPSQYKWCKNKQSKFLKLQKVKIKYFVNAVTSRKYRSLYEEKLARIGYRFQKYIHISSMKNLIEAIHFTQTMAQWLVKYPST